MSDKFRRRRQLTTAMDRSLKYLFLFLYVLISFVLFDDIYATSTEIIDELFHIGQGLKYCEGNFTSVRISICLHFLPAEFTYLTFLLVGSKNHNISWPVSPVGCYSN